MNEKWKWVRGKERMSVSERQIKRQNRRGLKKEWDKKEKEANGKKWKRERDNESERERERANETK